MLGEQSNHIRPMFIVAAAAVGIAGIVFGVVEHRAPTEHWSIEAIRSEYTRIRLPSGSRPLGQLDTLVKYGVTAVSGRYGMSNANINVLTHYRAELTVNGWSYLGDFLAGGHSGASYCKKKVLARVELLSAGEYAFSMSWGDVSERQCP